MVCLFCISYVNIHPCELTKGEIVIANYQLLKLRHKIKKLPTANLTNPWPILVWDLGLLDLILLFFFSFFSPYCIILTPFL